MARIVLYERRPLESLMSHVAMDLGPLSEEERNELARANGQRTLKKLRDADARAELEARNTDRGEPHFEEALSELDPPMRGEPTDRASVLTDKDASAQRNPMPVRSRTSPFIRAGAVLGPLLGVAALAVAWHATQLNDTLRADVNTALLDVDHQLAGQQATNTQMQSRIEMLSADIQNTLTLVAGLGIDELKAAAVALRADLFDIEQDMEKAMQTQNQVDRLSTAFEQLSATVSAQDNRLLELANREPITASTVTAPVQPAAPKVVASMEGATFVQVDTWGSERHVVMRDERGHYFTLAQGDHLSDYVLLELDQYSALFERGGEHFKLMQRGM